MPQSNISVSIPLVLSRLAIAFTAIISVNAQAQSPEVAEQRVLEEVVVTARKREESVQDIPMLITATSAQQLADRGVQTTADALTTVPNLNMISNVSSSANISIRGVNSNTSNIGTESGIGMQVDGVPLGRPSYFNTALMDIERIEVLRGPQGTLYGKNTTGGLINVITARPQQEFSAAGDLTFGNYDLRQFRGYVTGGFDDGGKVSARLAVTSVKRDGWAEDRNPANDDFQGVDFEGARLHLLFKPSDQLSLLLTTFYSKDDAVENFQDIQGGAAYPIDGMDGWDRSIYTSENNFFAREIAGASLNVDYQLSSGLTFTSVTGLLENDSESWNDQDYTIIELLATGRRDNQDQFSQEFRIASDNEGAFTWLAGVYFLDQTQDGRDRAELKSDTPILLGLPFPVPGYEEAVSTESEIDAQSYAGFLAGSWAISDRWELSGGVRLTREEKQLGYEQTVELFELAPGVPLGIILAFGRPVPFLQQEIDSTEPSGDISLSYLANESTRVYTRLAHGFKAGGFDATLSSVGDPGELIFEPETIDSIEVGFKSSMANNRVQLNAAAFYFEWDDKQEQFFNGANFITSNAASAENMGVEVELVALLTDNLQLTTTIGHQNAEYKDFFDPLIGQDNTGNKLPYSPDWSGLLALDYGMAVPGGGRLFFRGEAQYRDSNFTDSVNDPRFVQDSRVELNARLGVSSPSDAISLSVWGKNITGEDYITGGFSFFGSEIASVNAPVLWGVELRAAF